MTKLFTFIAFFLLFLAPATGLCADYDDGARVPDAVVAPLMAWVEAQTGVHVPNLPRVIASSTQLRQIAFRMGAQAGRARALYVGGVVFIDHRTFDSEEPSELSFLVHELVHYAQAFKRDGAWACAQSKEVEAYTLQNAWLAQQGHSPIVSASWIQRMAACPSAPTTVALAQAE